MKEVSPPTDPPAPLEVPDFVPSEFDFDLRAGTQDFYLDPLYYDHEFKHRRDDTRWYTERYVEVAGPVLELGVGTGRVALPAVRRGATVVGLDASPSMLRYLAERRDELPAKHRGRLNLVQGDMRRFAFDHRFDLISCPFNAFQHLYDRRDALQCLNMVREHLAPEGRFAFDVLLPDLEYLVRPSHKRYPGVRFKHPTHGCFYRYSERSAYDPVRQINQMWFHYDRELDEGEYPATAKGPESFVIQLAHRCFYPEEMAGLLDQAGLRIVERTGDFDGGPLRADSESMVFVCARSR